MTNHQDTSTEREKLKPCPFCGGAAKFNIINDDPEGPNHQGHYIECEGCGASTKLMFSCGEDCRPALAELWNRRAALASRDEAAHPMLRTLTREQINSIMTKHYPLSSLLREEVDAFEACVRDIEKALFTSPPPKSDEARDALISIGGQLASVAFNLAQRAGHALTGDDVAMLDKLRKQWDAALAAQQSKGEAA